MTGPNNLHKKPRRLNRRTFQQAVCFLTERDPGLAEIVNRFGSPTMWFRDEGFQSLVLIILEQQVSLLSAKAAFNRLLAAAAPLTPERFLPFEDSTLKAFGFSRQKIDYCRNLAHAILQGGIDLTALRAMDDATARSELIKIKGIGNWTADIYLLTALGRPDIWPGGDLALAVAIQSIRKLSSRPAPKDMAVISVDWMPWRSVAARLLWHFYLNNGHRSR